MANDNKKVYVSLIADLLHAGHIKVLREAEKYGEVTVGLLTKTAIDEMNDTAYLKYEQRQAVINSLSMVYSVLTENDLLPALVWWKENHSEDINKKLDWTVHAFETKDNIEWIQKMDIKC